MRLAFSTLGCPSLSLSEVLACARRCGYRELEIRLDRENRLYGYSADNADAAVWMLADNEINVTDLGTGLTFMGASGEHLEEIAACARLASVVEARALRVFAGVHVRVPTEIPAEDTKAVAASLSAAAAVAEAYGVELWVETHSAYSTGESVAALMREVTHRGVRVIWDVMHSVEFGEAPMETVRLIGEFIAHVHLKDGIPPASDVSAHYVLTALGEGAIDFSEIAESLSSIGYDGALSLEWELQWHPELASCYADTDALLRAYTELASRYFPIS